MPVPPNTVQITLGAALQEAADRYCAKRQIGMSELGREAIAAAIGRPKLAQGVRRGRPRKS